MLRGATTGGIDIIIRIFNRKYQNISIGKFYLYFDGFIVIMSAFVYRDIQAALYTMLAIFLSSRIIDIVLYGNNACRLFFIITGEPQKLEQKILSELKRGVTEINVVGGFSGGQKTLLMCVVRNSEFTALKKMIDSSDKEAFYFITNVSDIYGKGFYK